MEQCGKKRSGKQDGVATHIIAEPDSLSSSAADLLAGVCTNGVSTVEIDEIGVAPLNIRPVSWSPVLTWYGVANGRFLKTTN
jgi:hypothetical protein